MRTGKGYAQEPSTLSVVFYSVRKIPEAKRAKNKDFIKWVQVTKTVLLTFLSVSGSWSGVQGRCFHWRGHQNVNPVAGRALF